MKSLVTMLNTRLFVFAFYDQECNIHEELISFMKMERVRAVDSASAIISSIENLVLNLESLRGQGYDEASTMSGERAGVQARIHERQPKVLYTNCTGHSLNLKAVVRRVHINLAESPCLTLLLPPH